MEDDDFSNGNSGASTTIPTQCSTLKKNGFVVLKGHCCKIVDMTTSKTGKHGHAKVHLIGIDIFTQKKYEDQCPSTHNMKVPGVTRTDYTVLGIDDGFLSLLLDSGEIRQDLKLPENEMRREIERRVLNEEEMIIITVTKALGEEQITAIRTQTY